MWDILYKFYFKWSHIAKFWKSYFGPWVLSFKWRISQHVMLLSFFFSFFPVTNNYNIFFSWTSSRVFQKVWFHFLDSFLANGSVATKAVNWTFHAISMCQRHYKFSFMMWRFWKMLPDPAFSFAKGLRYFENFDWGWNFTFFSPFCIYLQLLCLTLFVFKLAFGHLRSFYSFFCQSFSFVFS